MLSQALILTSDRTYADAMRAALLQLGPARIDVEMDGLRAMQLVPQPYGVILVDLQLNAMDGLQLLLLLRQQAPASLFVAVGDVDTEAARALAYQSGADLFLSRPQTSAAFTKAANEIGALLEPTTGETEEEPLERVADLVETSCLSGDSVLLHVRAADQTGDIFVHEGHVFHAQYPGKSGVAAFREIVTWNEGLARVKKLKIQHLPPRTIEIPCRDLLQQSLAIDALPGGERIPPNEMLVGLAGGTTVADPATDFFGEAPPLPEISGDVASPRPAPESGAGLPPLYAHWQIDLSGNLVESSAALDPERCAFISSFIYRKLADVAVTLKVDYFDHLTLWGPQFQQVVAASNNGVRHALFESFCTSEEQREQYLAWCCDPSV